MHQDTNYTAFDGERCIATGPLGQLLATLKQCADRGSDGRVLVFEDRTGRQVEFDLTGSLDEVLARVAPEPEPVRTGPGRPRLGVVSREISLLPRHWEWLEQQSGGISATLRRLVDEARKRDPEKQQERRAMEASGKFMSAMAGNRPGYEEASRALHARDRTRLETLIAPWPADIRSHLVRLLDARSDALE